MRGVMEGTPDIFFMAEAFCTFSRKKKKKFMHYFVTRIIISRPCLLLSFALAKSFLTPGLRLLRLELNIFAALCLWGLLTPLSRKQHLICLVPCSVLHMVSDSPWCAMATFKRIESCSKFSMWIFTKETDRKCEDLVVKNLLGIQK